MKFNPVLISGLSGKLGGLVAAANAGGPYFRLKGSVTNPNTPLQQQTKNAMSVVSKRWRTLTNAQRTQWGVYAATVPFSNNNVAQYFLSPSSMYTRCMQPREFTSDTLIDDGPIETGLPPFSVIDVTVDTFPNDMIITLDTADPWINDDLGIMYVRASQGQNQSINYFKSPFALVGQINGTTVGPAPGTLVIPSLPSWVEDKKVFVTIRVSDAEGRLSEAFETVVTASV